MKPLEDFGFKKVTIVHEEVCLRLASEGCHSMKVLGGIRRRFRQTSQRSQAAPGTNNHLQGIKSTLGALAHSLNCFAIAKSSLIRG